VVTVAAGHQDGSEPSSWDEALQRLEDFILAYPPGRALPHVDEIAARANLPKGFLRGDERAHKVLLEAVAARPLSSREQVAQVRTEVELLTLEVQVLTDRLDDPSTPEGERRRAAERLAAVRSRLEEIRDVL
jgi:hypothetical protein